MRIACVLGLVLSLVLGPSVTPAARAETSATLIDVFHALEGRTLFISGTLRNNGPLPLPPLVIDASGYGPSGELVASGTDGIPWQVQPGAIERFSMALPLGPQFVREYVVQISVPRVPRPLAVERRSVDFDLYRQHVRTLIHVQGDTRNGLLFLRADTGGLPISQVSVRASLWALDPFTEWFKLVTLDFDVDADHTTIVFVSTTLAVLVSLQITDVRFKASWGN